MDTRSQTVGRNIMNRWWVVVGAVLIQLSLGAIYAWSVFTKALMKPPFSFSEARTQVIFSVALATFAVFTILAGRWQAKVGPQRVVRWGGVLLAVGYVAAGLVERVLPGHLFAGMLVTVGLVGGAGIGMAYVVPIACGVKWFPDKKGLVTGLSGRGIRIWRAHLD